jgi:hypothetical protein
MVSAAETNMTGTLYNGKKKRFTWEMYAQINMEKHVFLNGLKD